MKYQTVLLSALFIFKCSILFGQAPAQGNKTVELKEIDELRAEVQQLRQEIADMRASVASEVHREPTPAQAEVETEHAEDRSVQAAETGSSSALASLPGSATLNLTFDGYYGFNFNRPVGRVNLIRAYDVYSNSFSINQATVILERAPDVSAGRRWGARVDLQYGQATETLQGSASNELRPQVYRPLFQAYGTYVAPIGRGLNIDFGKFASSIGLEGNYSKDQINYSRALWFNFLPFYHMGIRTSYPLSDRVTLNYWMVNGAQSTETVNDFKDQLIGLSLTPRKSLSWTINYYIGQEHPDVVPSLNPTSPPTPGAQPGQSITPVTNPETGKLHIFDTYATWQASPRWTFGGEADYVVQRAFVHSSPTRDSGGALYARLQLDQRSALGARAEYLSDRGGSFTGLTQALKETTLTYDFKLATGLIVRPDYRRDFSNQPFFLTQAPGVRKKEQNTATVGLIWWWGAKEGQW